MPISGWLLMMQRRSSGHNVYARSFCNLLRAETITSTFTLTLIPIFDLFHSLILFTTTLLTFDKRWWGFGSEAGGNNRYKWCFQTNTKDVLLSQLTMPDWCTRRTTARAAMTCACAPWNTFQYFLYFIIPQNTLNGGEYYFTLILIFHLINYLFTKQ